MLLLYHTSMSCKSPGDWNEFDYKTQVIPSGFPLRTRGAGGKRRCLSGGLLRDLPSCSGPLERWGGGRGALGNQRLVTASVGTRRCGHGQAGSCPLPRACCGHCLAGAALPANRSNCSRAADPAAPPTQVELASILKFVLDNEESLNENLETFLQRKGERRALAACALAPARSKGPSLVQAEQALGTFFS